MRASERALLAWAGIPRAVPYLASGVLAARTFCCISPLDFKPSAAPLYCWVRRCLQYGTSPVLVSLELLRRFSSNQGCSESATNSNPHLLIVKQ